MKYNFLLLKLVIMLLSVTVLQSMDRRESASTEILTSILQNQKLFFKLFNHDIKIRLAKFVIDQHEHVNILPYVVPPDIPYPIPPLRRSQKRTNLVTNDIKRLLDQLAGVSKSNQEGSVNHNNHHSILCAMDPTSPPSEPSNHPFSHVKGQRPRANSLMRSAELGYSRPQIFSKIESQEPTRDSSSDSMVINLEEKLLPLILRFGSETIEDQLTPKQLNTLRTVKSASPRLQNAQERYDQTQTLRALRGRSSTSGLQPLKDSTPVPTLVALNPTHVRRSSMSRAAASAAITRKNSLRGDSDSRPNSPLRNSSSSNPDKDSQQ